MFDLRRNRGRALRASLPAWSARAGAAPDDGSRPRVTPLRRTFPAAGERPILCLVTDRRISRTPLAAAVAAAVEAGVDAVQIRERDLGGAALLALADELAAAARRAARARGANVAIVVNRRTDVALALGDAGVHLGFDAVGPEDARRLLGADLPVGISAHTPGEVAAAARAGASYAFLAPIFAPRSKPQERPALGAAAIEAAARAGIPVLAQGGCDEASAAAVLAAGAAGIAVTGAILMAEDPGAAAARIRRALDEARVTPPGA